MKKSLLFISVLLGAFSSMAQNPFAENGYTPKIATLSQGKYNETFDSDTLVQIGSVLFNTKSKQIVAFVQLDTLYSEATLEPDIVSRWLSPDPLADEYPSWSPYNFVLNNPIRFVDPDGRMPTDPLFNKGMGNGAINAVKGFWNFVVDTYATRGGNIVDAAVGAKNFAVAAYNDPSGTADAVVAATKQGVVNSIVENGSINGALGAITGEVAVGVFTGMAADKGLSKLGTVAKVTDKVEDVANMSTNVLSKGELLRIENAATRINKPITVVGSRAKGTAGAYSDWDYVIPELNSKNWSTIKNSLPGARSVLDNTPRNIDIFKGPVNTNLPHITIYPR